jgi:hypothetical protein
MDELLSGTEKEEGDIKEEDDEEGKELCTVIVVDRAGSAVKLLDLSLYRSC